MNLHKDRELFEQTIRETAYSIKVSEEIVEKDYHITLLLRELTQQLPVLVFKGGTSLSKCFHTINRFSEDIDLAYDNNGLPPTETMRSKTNRAILDIAAQSGYRIENREKIWSNRSFNRFVFSYEPVFTDSMTIRPAVVIETVFDISPFPLGIGKVSSFIAEYATKTNLDPICQQYNLSSFDVKVQTIERTFVDKVFALCDYWMRENVTEHSRHLYDLYKLKPSIDQEQLADLVKDVRTQRRRRDDCPSAQEGCNINNVLNTIYELDAYQSDYDKITKYLLRESLPYDEVKCVLQDIIKMNLF